MVAAFSEWTVLEHGPLVQLADNLWWVQGALPGMSLRRCMTVARRSDGQLVVHSAIALAPAALAELEALGPLGFLVVPNAMHRLDAPAYKRRFPGLRVFAPTGSRSKIERVVPVDGAFEEFPADPAVQLEPLQGVGALEGLMRVNSPDGTSLVLADTVFNMDRKRDPLGFLITTVLGSAPGPRVSRLTKRILIRDRQAFRRELERLSEIPDLQRLIVAHEKVASGPAAREALRTAATYL